MSPSILIVDDEPGLNELFVIGLRKYGFSSEGVLGGNECLEKLKSFHPDLILLDMMMEPMDGHETLVHLKEQNSTKDIPVIVLTGKVLASDEAMWFAFIIEDYLMKPVTPKQSVEYINNVLKNVNERKELIDKCSSQGIDDKEIENIENYNRAAEVANKLEKVLMLRYGNGCSAETIKEMEDYLSFKKEVQSKYQNFLKNYSL